MQNAYTTTAPTITSEMLTRAELASALRVSKRTIDTLVIQGLPHFALSRTHRRFDLQDVRRWLHNRQ